MEIQDLCASHRISSIVAAPDDSVLLTVWASLDGCQPWPLERPVHEGPSTCSSLAAARHGNVHLLFEPGRGKLHETIAVAAFRLDWLLGGA